MIHSWFYADTWLIVATCFAGAAALAALAHRLALRSALFAPVRAKPVGAPYFTASASLFALFLAFNAAHAWSNDAAADRAAAAERAASARIRTSRRASTPSRRNGWRLSAPIWRR